MTSEPIEAYGGISIPVEMLRDVAQQIEANGVPFHLDHNMSTPLRVRGFEAFVESRPDGFDELRFHAEIHEGDFHWLESRQGVSATIMAPLARDQNRVRNHGAAIRISADNAWFADDALIEAEEQLIARGVAREIIQVERAYQFSFVPDPQIFVDVVYPILLSIGASAIWDGAKKIFDQRRTPSSGDATAPTVVNVSIADGDRSLRAVVTTSDEAVAQRAIESLDQAVTAFFQSTPISPPEDNRKSITVWDDESGNWAPPA
ncbi:hypothetical protein [Specibacter sp. NPDC078692]|uniref:hypothetical protein n=1 Tax=Specibacter sp. NPDC078692 TaxID=3155818 RepID=UPI0034290132